METGRHHDEPPVIVVSTSLRGNLQLSWCLPVSVGTSSYRGVYHSPWEPPVIVVSASLRFPRRMADTTITRGSHGEW
jgi:hypothetical protein